MSLFFNVSPAYFAQAVLAYLVSYSLRFDGTGDYLSWSNPPESNRKTNTFSLWFKPMENAVNNAILFQQRKATLGTKDLQFTIQMRVVSGRNSLRILGQENDINDIILDSGTDLDFEAGTWYNLVVAVDTTIPNPNNTDRVKVWVNGQLYTGWATATYPSQNYNTGINRANTRMLIGVQRPNSSATLNTYSNIQLAEYHFIDGTAYDETYFGETRDGVWVPKEVTDVTYGNNGFYLDFKGNDTGVTLLLDGTSTTDKSSASTGLTNNGSITTTSLAGPSGYGTVSALDLNGSTQYLSTTYYTSSLYNQDFTIEGWFYIDNAVGDRSFFSHRSSGSAYDSVIPYISASSTYGLVVGAGTSPWEIVTTGGSVTTGWHHIAVTRNGNDYVLWVDGTSTLTGTYSGTVSASGNFAIGAGSSTTPSQYIDGKVFDFRVTEGVARYTDSFTPPTSALSADVSGITGSDDVVLLLDGSSDTTDASGNQTISETGNVTPVTATGHPYATSSLDFDTSVTSYLKTGITTDFKFGTEPFTIEFWMKPDTLNTSASNASYSTIMENESGSIYTGSWFVVNQINGEIYFAVSSGATSITTSGSGISTTSWSHVAIVRGPDNTCTVYVDGTSKGSATISQNLTDLNNRTLVVGKQLSVARRYDGQLTDIRIAKGAALYPQQSPTSALTNTPEYLGDFGVDRTTNNNDFSVEGNISADDQLLDTPNLRFASFDPDNKGANVTLSEANYNSVSSSGYSSVITTETIPTGSKIYVEWTCDNSGALNFIGIAPSLPTGYVGDAITGWGLYMPLASGDLEIWNNGVKLGDALSGSGAAAPHVAMMAVDRVSNEIHFGYNGLWRTTTTATTTLPSTAPVTSIDSNSTYYIVASPSPSRSVITNLGQDHTFAGAKSTLLTPYSDANGVGEFYYQPPSGFLALATEYK